MALGLGQRTALADDWTEFGLSQTRSRLSAETSGPNFSAGVWTYQLPPVQDYLYRALIASPAVGDGFVVFGTSDRRIRALRESDGSPVWELAVGGAVHASPAIHGGLVYVAALDRQLYALSVDSGVLVWKRDLGGIAYSSPVVAEGSVFVAAGNPAPRVFRLDPETGNVQWIAGEGLLQQATHASVAVANGHVLVGEMEGRVHSFAVATGAHEWTYQTGGTLNLSSPLVIDGRVYLLPGGDEHRLFAVDSATGGPVPGWPIEIATPNDVLSGKRIAQNRVVSSPAGSADRIVFDLRMDELVDTDADGAGDTWLFREFTVGVDPTGAAVSWIDPNGRVVSTDPNQVPKYGLCPVPALYRTARGKKLVVTASTLAPRIRVLDSATGVERWSTGLSGPTRGSPVMANGRLFVGTDAGVVHALLSATNQPPKPPMAGFFPSNGQVVDAASVALRWRPAFDAEAEALTYQVRFDTDGELLRSWEGTVTTSPGQASARVDHALRPDQTYTYAIRSRDPRGAWSAWSAAQSFRAVASPPVSIAGRGFEGLNTAINAAVPGDIVTLGTGTYHLSGPIRLPGGVGLAGAGPHLTVIDASGMDVGISVENASGQATRLSGMTVSHASTGIRISDAHDVELRNVIVRDNLQSGIEVGASGTAHVINVTVFANAVGIQAYGSTDVRNSIVTSNGTGMTAPDPSLVTSHHNDIFDNRNVDVENVVAGLGDMSRAVQFQSPDGRDLRLQPDQVTTDRGDPSDPFDLEPPPNGGRVNMGAFGNTPFAEPSAKPPTPPTPTPTPVLTSGGPNAARRALAPTSGLSSAPETAPAGCACSAAPQSGPPWLGGGALMSLALVVFLRRRHLVHRRST